MRLLSIKIENYRSIKSIPLIINVRDDNSFTYGLIWINEAGKSSILKAIGLKDELLDESGIKLPLKKDFRLEAEVIITYKYEINKKQDKTLYETLNKEITTSNSELETSLSTEEAKKAKNIISDDLIVNYMVSFSEENIEPEYSIWVFNWEHEIDIKNKDEFDELIEDSVHRTIFWTAEDRYLISKPINIAQFSNDTSISIPLRNCFLLSWIKLSEIWKKLNNALLDTTECEHLEELLGENVTTHIKAAWPNHPIKITFKIMDGNINFHVKDIWAKWKAQTSDMRSDGFKQFISFLLTVSAENKNEELQNTILLLDEPETHLHPKAQEYLLTQLINITNNQKNNIVFFATHSNYMIDKKDLGKYYRVEKKKNTEGDECTHIDQFNKKETSYAEVSYEVFDILDEQYHNELYDKLRNIYISMKNSEESDDSKQIDTIWINPFDEQYLKQIKKLPKDHKDTSKFSDPKAKVTLPTFVRNCIHYPVNKKDDFDEKLKESISILKGYLN